MPGEDRTGQSRVVVLDLTRADIRGYADGRVLRQPSAVFGDDAGRLSFGHEAIRRGLDAPAGLEDRLLDWVDDEHLALGSRLHAVGELIRALLRHTIGALREGAGGEAPGLLVLTVPECWGGPRRSVLDRAAAGLARRVELASSATAVLGGALLDFPELDLRKVVVVEVEGDRAVACVVADPTRLLPTARLGPAPQAAVREAAPGGGLWKPAELWELAEHASGPGLAASAVVLAARGAGELDAGLRRELPGNVRIVDGDCALRGAVRFAELLSSQV